MITMPHKKGHALPAKLSLSEIGCVHTFLLYFTSHSDCIQFMLCYSVTVIMAPKHCGRDPAGAKGKRQRKSLRLEIKLNTLKHHCGG